MSQTCDGIVVYVADLLMTKQQSCQAVMHWLQGSYRETGVMALSLNRVKKFQTTTS